MLRPALASALTLALAACSHDAIEPAKPATGSPFERFAETSPREGDRAPPLELRDLDGAAVSLTTALASGPVVLISGSYTCPLFRMKMPGFERLATQWQGRVTFLVVYTEEAHARAAGSSRLNGFSEQVRALDRDRDGKITTAEYGTFGPRYMFDALDVDRDGSVRSHEIIATRRIDQFTAVDAPRTLDERIALARRFRAEVPSQIRVLVDPLHQPAAKAYGSLPNFAYIIDPAGRVAFKQAWASVNDVELRLSLLTGGPRQLDAPPPDLAVLADARRAGRPVLVELTAPGCAACVRMDAILADAGVQRAVSSFELVRLSVEADPAWRLLEDLELDATPSFAIVQPDGTIAGTLEAPQTRERLLSFLADPSTGDWRNVVP